MRQIRAAYVARARLAHPDLVGRKGLDVMRALNEAWATLKDEARKTEWDVANRPAGSSRRPGTIGEDGLERPFWTGAMGPAPGRASGAVLRFGIYDGWSIGEIARTDRGYLMWLRDRPEGASIRDQIVRLLDPDADQSSEPGLGRRR